MLVPTNGLAGWTQIVSLIRTRHSDITDDELNEIIRAVQAEAARRKKISEDIAAGL